MKPLFSILFFIISFTSYTQDTRLFENEWFLRKLTIGDNSFSDPKNDEGYPISLRFEERVDDFFFTTAVCNSIEWELIFDDANLAFNVVPGFQSLGGCSNFGDTSNIEYDYFNFYAVGSMFSYEITENLDILILTITTANGDQAIYNNLNETERIEEGHWLLQNLIVNSEDNLNPLNSEGTPITTQFSSNTFESDICESISGNINYAAGFNYLSLSEVNQTLGGCNIVPGTNESDVYDIQDKLLSFFSRNNYAYIIVGANNNSPRKLIIDAFDNNRAIYIRPSLSTKKFSNRFFTIYPNPVKDRLSIKSTNNLGDFKIKIIDFSGKEVMINETQNINSINVEKLSQGIYFISIEDELGNTQTQKFIKI